MMVLKNSKYLNLYVEKTSTICPGSSDSFYVVPYYLKWVNNSWTHSMLKTMLMIRPCCSVDDGDMTGRRDASLLSSLLLPALLLVAVLLRPAGAAGNVGEYTVHSYHCPLVAIP